MADVLDTVVTSASDNFSSFGLLEVAAIVSTWMLAIR
jgi:hypothetical protein